MRDVKHFEYLAWLKALSDNGIVLDSNFDITAVTHIGRVFYLTILTTPEDRRVCATTAWVSS